MTKRETDSMKTLLDFHDLQAETIALEPDCIERALQLSSRVQNHEEQWQTYLNALALFGFQQWLSDRAPEIPIFEENCSVFQPQCDSPIAVVYNLLVGDFKLCLTVMGSLTEKAIAIPRAAIELPEFTAHFYVVVEVWEELEQAKIQGFLRYDRLLHHLQGIETLRETSPPAYQLPLTCFENDANLLLLYLRCLEPTVISLPSNSQPVNILQLITRSYVNVGLWLRDEIDEVARGLSWVLLPAFAPDVVPLRSPTQELEVILTELQRVGTQIPPESRSAYRDLQLAQTGVRLYAVTWPFLSPEDVPEWRLLLVLGAQPGYQLPDGTLMRVSDETDVLVETVLNRDTDDNYLYARVAGTWDETFLVTVALRNGATVTLPPFAFRPNYPL